MTTTMQRPAAHPPEEDEAVAPTPAPGPGRRHRRTVVVALVAAFLLAAAVVGGVGGTSRTDVPGVPDVPGFSPDERTAVESVTGGDPTGLATEEPAMRSVPPDVAGSTVPFSATAPLPGTGPRVVRTASLTVVVPRPAAVDDAVSVARTTAETNGGYVGDLDRSVFDGAARATVTLRVPAASFDAVTARLEKIGDVATSSLGGADVTQESVDLEARLRSLNAQADALRAILAQATTVPDILAVRQQLDVVQSEIEIVTGRAAQLADAVAFATVTATFTTSAASVAPQPDPWWRVTLGTAAARLGTVTGAIVVGAAALLPVVLLVSLGWVAFAAVRRRRRAATTIAPDA
jgi:hypothetical protein